MFVAETPGLLKVTVAPAVKLVPVMVTCTAVPGDALAGETDDRVGAPGFTVKETALLVPAAVVTLAVYVPGGGEVVTLTVALICVALGMEMFVAETPGLLKVTVAPAVKLVPVMVTCTAVPGDALAGETEDRVGAPGFTVKETVLLVPAAVVTAML